MLRIVIAVKHGGADSVLFECGHVCSLEPAAQRRNVYPKRRHCFRCPREDPVNLIRAKERFGHASGNQRIDWRDEEA